jgi:diaminohydroxyphosphoribosylaminopyrimidine deaminase/5-amino-6-(5-phosphoribosylamino)uracil reductase
LSRFINGIKPNIWRMKPHEHWMREAIKAAEQAQGKTGDNPAVGCVLVAEDQALVRGWTHPPGGDHAEAHAIRQARVQGIDLERVTLYCTLEPCAFVGRTPACALTIRDAGIPRVVIGVRDPHPRVNGAGVQILREAGIEVLEGVCAPDVTVSLQDWLHQFEPQSEDGQEGEFQDEGVPSSPVR